MLIVGCAVVDRSASGLRGISALDDEDKSKGQSHFASLVELSLVVPDNFYRVYRRGKRCTSDGIDVHTVSSQS